jgi:hypothetical protein
LEYEPVTISSLLATPSSPQALGTPIELTTIAAGGNGSYEYKFHVKPPGLPWIVDAQPYSNNNVFNWDTNALTEVGSYTIQTMVRQAGSTDDYQAVKNVTMVLN